MLEQLERELRSLIKGEFSSLTIGFNDEHACNYVDAQQWHDDYGMYGGGDDRDCIRWVSEQEREKALAENSVWTLHWYPDTPVGFNYVAASSLTALLEWVRENG